MELNKKREMEVGRMRKDLEEASIQQESTMLSLRKKHQDAISEMSEQIEQLNKLKTRYSNIAFIFLQDSRFGTCMTCDDYL